MKKFYTSLFLSLALLLSLQGCAIASLKTAETAPPTMPAAAQEAESSAVTQANQEETAELPTFPETEYTEPLPELSPDAYQVVYNITAEGEEESGIFQGIDPDGSLVWTYETRHYPLAQLPQITPAGRFQDRYYLIEGGTVVALDIVSGAVLFENREFQGRPCEDAMLIDRYGYLYLCGFDSPDFFAMDPQGRTVKRIDRLSDQYIRPKRIQEENGQLVVYMESDLQGNLGDFPCEIPVDWLPQPMG